MATTFTRGKASSKLTVVGCVSCKMEAVSGDPAKAVTVWTVLVGAWVVDCHNRVNTHAYIDLPVHGQSHCAFGSHHVCLSVTVCVDKLISHSVC